MRISVGIVAWNEAVSIGMTIDSLFSQQLFQCHHEGVEGIEIVVLANGCTDDTSVVAMNAINKCLAMCPLKYVSARVCELPGPDRPGAWNELVHRISNRRSDYIVMMDGDIYFSSRDTIWQLVRSLEEDPYAHAAASMATKDVALKRRRTVKDRVSLVMTDMTRRVVDNLKRRILTGGCYCGRAAYWRRIELPAGMRGDDAFLTRMAVTSLLTTPPDERRIACPEGATFVFEAYDSLWVLFKQHRRRMVGRYIESLIYEAVGAEICRSGGDAGEVLHRWNREDPGWLVKMIRQRVAKAGSCIYPLGRMLSRWRQAAYQPFPRSVFLFPLAMLGSVWDLAVGLAATNVMKRNQTHKVWFDTRNKRLLNEQYRMGLEAERDSLQQECPGHAVARASAR